MLNSQLNDSWNLFKHIFKKEYLSNQEETYRRQIWEENLSIIRKHNLESDFGMHTYTLEMNQFGDMTNEEFRKQMNGYKMNLKNETIKFDRHKFLTPSNIVLPESVDWRTKGYVTPIKDQGQCGSCWAFSTTGSLEGQHFAKTSKLVSLSEQNLVDCSLNLGCHGGIMDLAFLYIKSNGGIDTEWSYPYEAERRKCRFDPKNIGATDTGFVEIKMENETDLQFAIATVGPISVAIDASKSSFQFYSSGVYDEPHCSTYLLDHGVLAVGYGTINSKDYYIVKNSWGTNWGNQGYIWMSRNKNNQCGIATVASYPLV
ncbi:unnamed protein product [Rotaria sp. Silwood1]|nr:unnamed protein product [Rotaria sp. Silwood1]CAF3714381.1 unnamed protein product [Rotaria sp. Silwood1]CAF4953765.1 unnamed protein product [Rotaria sp. Silwood1]CAF5084859.1 unnamed protein product [Rotaria sp. Silwood1]